MKHRPLAALLVAALAAGCELTTGPKPVESTAPPAAHVVRDLVGPGCDEYIRSHPTGPGSPGAMAKQSVVAAIASNPELTQAARAVSGKLNPTVDLSKELASGRFTIFVPVDDAVAKLPSSVLDTLSAPDAAAALAGLLRGHVAKGERTPDRLSDELTTLDGTDLKVAVDRDRIRVGGQANVICGGFHTRNATLFLIDGVLMPPDSGRAPSAEPSSRPTPSPSPTTSASAADQE